MSSFVCFSICENYCTLSIELAGVLPYRAFFPEDVE